MRQSSLRIWSKQLLLLENKLTLWNAYHPDLDHRGLKSNVLFKHFPKKHTYENKYRTSLINTTHCTSCVIPLFNMYLINCIGRCTHIEHLRLDILKKFENVKQIARNCSRNLHRRLTFNLYNTHLAKI